MFRIKIIEVTQVPTTKNRRERLTAASDSPYGYVPAPEGAMEDVEREALIRKRWALELYADVCPDAVLPDIAYLLGLLDSTTAALEEARKDSARLDWLRDNVECGLTARAIEGRDALWAFWTPFRRAGLRAAIDAARSSAPEGSKP